MGASLESEILPVVSSLKVKNWVRLVCSESEEPVREGIYTAGGCVVGQFHGPDVYYKEHYGIEVLILLDPVLDGKPFFVLIQDITFIEILHPAVIDD